MSELLDFFNLAVQKHTQRPKSVFEYKMIGGGCINNTAYLHCEKTNLFIKWSRRDSIELFEKESKGLNLLKLSQTLRVPEVLDLGTIGKDNYLLLEYIETGRRSTDFWIQLGNGLADLHRITNTNYGLDHDNHIGRLPQQNTFKPDWIDFFIHQRLLVQLHLRNARDLVKTKERHQFDELFKLLPDLLTNEPPSLLHGDLWSGNFMVSQVGNPVLIDPAVYYGNREIELAFTQLFGGYDDSFYASYFDNYPVEPGFQERADIYNLYPLLVHLNLFGSSYLSGIRMVLDKYT